MRPSRWMLTLLLLALAPLGAQDQQALWQPAVFTWVRRVPAEPGAPPSAHPAQLSPEALQTLLTPVKVQVGRKQVPLFGRDELKELTPILSEALALARPDEDLILLSTGRHDGGFMAPSEGLTARLFMQGEALHLLVHDARLEFLIAYRAMNAQPSFTYGSRAQASAEVLQAPGATRLRPDWLALPLAPAPVPAATPAPGAPPAASTPAATTTVGDDAAYQAKAQRLRTLKRLREENLITEAEYQKRRDAILKAL